jgi:hypothetical protein
LNELSVLDEKTFSGFMGEMRAGVREILRRLDEATSHMQRQDDMIHEQSRRCAACQVRIEGLEHDHDAIHSRVEDSEERVNKAEHSIAAAIYEAKGAAGVIARANGQSSRFWGIVASAAAAVAALAALAAMWKR